MPTTKNESNGKEVRVMPRRDGTGPIGMGSMTGRGAGFCTNRMNNQGLKKASVDLEIKEDAEEDSNQ